MTKYALLSVYHKEGVVDFARQLVYLGYTILSTGGTARLLEENDIAVKEVSDYTGHPEIFNGRVKTLHPKVFGGILADFTLDEHKKQAEENGIEKIDIVCVNLYPFFEVMCKDASQQEIIENIDVGGPSMIRAAAKNYRFTTVVVDPADYDVIVEKLKQGGIDEDYRQKLASKAFSTTARYDVIIHRYFSENLQKEEFPPFYNFTFEKVQDLRYGENPHQKAAVYKPFLDKETGVPNSKQLQGKQLSYNNILDANEALNIVKDFTRPTAAVIKHNNPCGVASADSLDVAFDKALKADPKSAFGGVIALNAPLDEKTAALMKPIFIEVIIAPSFSEQARKLLEGKKNLRLMETGEFVVDYSKPETRRISAGLLVQTRQFPQISEKDLKVVTKRKPTEQEIKDMLFAWKVNKHVKSNAIVFAKDEVTVGIGAGQMSRVDAVNLVKIKPESHPENSAMSSDAYFPFRDGLDEAVKAGATAIIQPGGSIRDEEVIKAADEHGIAMVFTGVRLFKH